MGTISYDALMGFVGAISAFCTGVALVGHERRQRVHIALGFFFINLGLAFFARALNWHSEGEIVIGYAYSLFAVMPLLFCIFVENLIRKPVSSRLKLGVVISMTFFIVTTWFEVTKTNPMWKLSFMLYHLISLSALLLPLRQYAKGPGLVQQERHVINSIFSVVAFGLIFIALEWLYTFGPFAGHSPRLSSVAVMIFSHNLTSIYFNEHRFSLKKEIITVVSFLVFSVLTAQILTIAGMSLGPYWVLVGLVFSSALAISTLNLQLISAYSTSGISRLVKQLVDTDKSQAPFFLRSVSEIAEFKDLRLIKPEVIESLHCEKIYDILGEGKVYSLQKLRAQLKSDQLMPELRDAYEAGLYFLISVGATAFVITRNQGDVLVASPVALRSTRYFDSLMMWAAQTLDLVIRSNESKKTSPARDQDLQVDSPRQMELQ